MATRRPAKLAIGKKTQHVKLCPITGKPMTAVKVFRTESGASMRWVVLEDFDGSADTIERMLPIGG